MKFTICFAWCLFLLSPVVFPQKKLKIQSPNGKIELNISIDEKLSWSILHENELLITPSVISLELKNGKTMGDNPQLIRHKITSVNQIIKANFYKKDKIVDHYQQIELNFKNNYSVIFRTYDDGVAYRFITTQKDSLWIKNERSDFNFAHDGLAYIPFVNDLRTKEPYISSFEALYDVKKLTDLPKDSLAFLPLLVKSNNGKNILLLEADLENYPGMFLEKGESLQLKAHLAPYPLQEEIGGFNTLNWVVTKRADFIAKTAGKNVFPWRAIIIAKDDKELLNNDMVQKLSKPNLISDVSWIKPGKVAWDWWNNWNISNVDFKSGINTETYKYYIDFASKNNIEYVIMDEGWSEHNNLMKVADVIDLTELLSYAKSKNVDIILWASWLAVNKDMEKAFKKYADLGVKGFKIDFLDRDDQKMVNSTYEIARTAAKYKLIIDYHGIYKPTGIQRTYPNVVNFEGVKGLENAKWAKDDNFPLYAVTAPFIRMVAGPMDYTPGAMRNALKSDYRPSNASPMSQGTRAHQVAMFVIFEAPLQMLADNPTAYMKEQETTDFIAQIPTVFNETLALDGKLGEYVAIARKSYKTWFVGALTNWDSREILIDFSFLGDGNYEAMVFKDGINADKEATDYKIEKIKISSQDQLKFHLSNGGGLSIRINPID
jgi:alpha-glucosidase